MFQTAIKKAMEFTHPVVVTYQRENGDTGSSIGTCIILNNEGWVLTVSHIVETMMSIENEIEAFNAYKAKVSEINSDSSLNRAERNKKLRSLDRPPKNPVANYSSWWGQDGWNIEQYHGLKIADIALGKISGYESSFVTSYPVFKNPDVNFDPGINLCKLGFPFNSIKPEFDENNNRFILPPSATPMRVMLISGV